MHSMSQPTLSPDTPALHRTYFPECDKLKDCPASCVSLLYLHPKIPCTHALSLILPVLQPVCFFLSERRNFFINFLIIFLIKQIRYICQESFYLFHFPDSPFLCRLLRIYPHFSLYNTCKKYARNILLILLDIPFRFFIPC